MSGYTFWPINSTLLEGTGKYFPLCPKKQDTLPVRKASYWEQGSRDANPPCKRKAILPRGIRVEEKRGKKKESPRELSLFHPPLSIPSIEVVSLPLRFIYKVLRTKSSKAITLPSPPQDKTGSPLRIFRERPGGHHASPAPSPCSGQGFLSRTSSAGPPGLPAPALSGTRNYSQHSTFLHPESLRLSSWEEHTPEGLCFRQR